MPVARAADRGCVPSRRTRDPTPRAAAATKLGPQAQCGPALWDVVAAAFDDLEPTRDREAIRSPHSARDQLEPRQAPGNSVRVFVLSPGARLLGRPFRGPFEQEVVVRRDEWVGRYHRVGVVDGAVLPREGDPARALSQPVL